MSEDQPHVTINPQEQQITPDIPQDGQYDEQGRFLGDIYKTAKREEIIAFNSPENKEMRRQEELQTEIGESAVQHEVDAPYAKRLEKLFAPVKIEETQTPAISYDSLLDPNNDLQYRHVEGAAVRNRGKQRGVVTEESLKVARDEYMEPLLQGSKDVRISEMIKAAAHNSPLTPEDAMQLLRGDNSLRKEVGAYLLDKLKSHTSSLPERVARNTQKNANMPGYEDIPSMSSHEYVALLALAKLDGSFNYEGYLQDSVQHDESGNVVLGQHRAAADMMLQGY
jgi:hypothetical protein